jgi:hypothetical protein
MITININNICLASLDTLQYDTNCYTVENNLPIPLCESNIPSMDHSISSMCYICYLKHAVV